MHFHAEAHKVWLPNKGRNFTKLSEAEQAMWVAFAKTAIRRVEER